MTKSTICFHLTVVVCSLLISGCATTGSPRIIEKHEKITTSGLDTQDFAAKAEQMIASLLDAGTLDKAPKRPAVIAIGRIIDQTGLTNPRIEIDLLTKKIRVSLNKGNKAVTDTTGGVLNTVDFTLSGKIIDTYSRVRDTRQHTYTIQLSLTDSQGLAVWEEEKEVTRLAKRSSTGI